jgi:hypothetical protein
MEPASKPYKPGSWIGYGTLLGTFIGILLGKLALGMIFGFFIGLAIDSNKRKAAKGDQ